jgi:hypothetical protein
VNPNRDSEYSAQRLAAANPFIHESNNPCMMAWLEYDFLIVIRPSYHDRWRNRKVVTTAIGIVPDYLKNVPPHAKNKGKCGFLTMD